MGMLVQRENQHASVTENEEEEVSVRRARFSS